MAFTPDELKKIAEDPAEAAQDGRSAKQHRLKDIVEFNRHLQSQELPDEINVRNRRMSRQGIRTSQFYPMD